MSTLPPVEQAQLQTQHLQLNPTLGVGGNSTHQTDQGRSWTTPKLSNFSFAFPKTIAGLSLGLRGTHFALFIIGFSLPLALVYLAQPAQPSFTAQEKQLSNNYIQEQQQNQPDENNPALMANQTDDSQPSVLAASTDTPSPLLEATGSPTTNTTSTTTTSQSDDELEATRTKAELAAAEGDTNKAYRYHLTIAQGFLQKAIQLSKQTASNQTPADQAKITEYIDKALEAANKAIELDATQGSGFLMRARIYQTASVLRPELKEYATQDKQIAEALGVNDNDLQNTDDILDLLPTQQANNIASAPVVADAEEGNDTQVNTQDTNNANQGRVTMAAGSDQVEVSYPQLNASQALRVDVASTAGADASDTDTDTDTDTGTANENPDNATFRVHTRQDGQGFTIKASQPLTQDVTLDWRAIDPLE